MATNKLLDDAGLNKLLTLLKAKFPLITSLATINGLSLVNGGNDIEIKGDKDVCFFESTPTINIAAITNGSGVGPIRWRSSSKTFVSESGDKLYNNFSGGDDFGDLTADGRAPVIGKLYIDTVSRKFYYWDSSDLICLTVDTSLYKVVTSLPTPSADTENKIYLVTGAKTATDNTHAEYITVMNGAKYVWEKLGEVGADEIREPWMFSSYSSGTATPEGFVDHAKAGDPVMLGSDSTIRRTGVVLYRTASYIYLATFTYQGIYLYNVNISTGKLTVSSSNVFSSYATTTTVSNLTTRVSTLETNLRDIDTILDNIIG